MLRQGCFILYKSIVLAVVMCFVMACSSSEQPRVASQVVTATVEALQVIHTPTPHPSPIATPTAINTVIPTATAEPTFTPTPKPSSTPKPTATPNPTKTPQPTPTPALDVGVSDMILNFFYDEVNADAKYAVPFTVIGRVERISEEGLELAGGFGDRVTAEVVNKKALSILSRNSSVSLYCQSADGRSDSIGVSIKLKKCTIILEVAVTPVATMATTVALEVSLGDIISDYVDNEIRADTKYAEPFIVPAATVIETSGKGIVLMEGGFYHVVADVPDKTELLDVGYGDRVSLRCEGAEGSADGLSVSIHLKECTLMPSGR